MDQKLKVDKELTKNENRIKIEFMQNFIKVLAYLRNAAMFV